MDLLWLVPDCVDVEPRALGAEPPISVDALSASAPSHEAFPVAPQTHRVCGRYSKDSLPVWPVNTLQHVNLSGKADYHNTVLFFFDFVSLGPIYLFMGHSQQEF